MMRQFALHALRERNVFHKLHTGSSRFKHSVALQLDYYMSSQFSGIACALVNNLYHDDMQLSFLPTCPVGLEQERVRKYQSEHPTHTTIGSVEQNIFIPTLHADPQLHVTAVAAMFRRSPLCILGAHDPIGAHEDTVSLIQRILPHRTVVASPRCSKNDDFLQGKLGGIQAYATTEVTTIRHLLQTEPVVTPLEGLNGAKLGYGQVLFTTDEVLQDTNRRDVVASFLQATFQGWDMSIRDPAEALLMVEEARKMLKLDDEQNDHWHPSVALQMLHSCNDYVKETFQGDRYGVISPSRWSDATKWLLNDPGMKQNYGLDASLWHPPPSLLAGNELARTLLEDAKKSALAFEAMYHRKPSLAVVQVGELERYAHAERRLQLYSNAANSWFSKTTTGDANGFHVQEIQLSASTTTEELLSQIYALKGMDGIQLMWPLPDHIDSAKVYNAIDLFQDVDGIHYIGQREIGNKNAFAPVTPAATMAFMTHHGIDVKGKHVLVIGRSPIVGSPIAHMLRERDAIVTVAHSEIDCLEQLVREADIVVSCAGCPGLIQAEWIRGIVIQVGTTFSTATDSLHSDLAGDIASFATQYSPVPGGVGPLSVPFLLQNVARAAWNRRKKGWDESPSSLHKTFHFKDYASALQFAEKINNMSTIMDHHANMKFTHQCIDGVDLHLEFFTWEANKITDKDYDAATAVDAVAAGGAIQMSDYTYDLDETKIAIYPAIPRGSSKLLRVNSQGEVSHCSNFSDAFVALAKGTHLVFNESRVLDARLFVTTPSGNKVEMMILDMGGVDIKAPCQESLLPVMLRTDQVKVGDLLSDTIGGMVEVIGINGVWEEDEKSDGNGTECMVRVLGTISMEEYLHVAGTVPIPPYFHRAAEASDKVSYNNVYAAADGSVAAPTAGLHFTEQVLTDLGAENCSFLSLHVGAGTFKPVLVSDARDHIMHAETFSVSVREIKRIIAAMDDGKPILAVGTTSSRTLESLYWCGVQRLRGTDTDRHHLVLDQFDWIPWMVGETATRRSAFQSLVEGLEDTDVISGKTSLMIVPGSYEFKVVDHLVTNFHAPDSTLMLLVSAFLQSGEKVKSVYDEAQREGYRFLSYGDVCMFSRPGSSK